MSRFPGIANPVQPQSITDFTSQIRVFLEGTFDSVWVEGEISGWKVAASGHVYFSLKDEGALLGAVMWKSSLQRSPHRFADGDRVEAKGKISVYDRRGQYQVVVDSLKPVGEGALYLKFLKLKEKLQAEGLFSEEKKRPIPTHPARVGIITSPKAAALQDILQIMARRAPGVELFLWPTAVQGEGAARQIAAGIHELGKSGLCDVLLVTRGGGSMEDLWEFNSELVVRAIAGCPVPVISAVGHEVDFTLCDFAADLRAPTPSAAAELVSQDQGEALRRAKILNDRLQQSIIRRLKDQRQRVESLLYSYSLRQPELRLGEAQQRLDEALARINTALDARREKLSRRIERACSALSGHNPQLILRKGYGILRNPESGAVYTSVHQLEPNLPLETTLQDGKFFSTVRKLKKD
ncbi:MAG: exodeoxyribonuclease VII large subunit [Sumerlaeia bacterium]